MAGDPSDQTAWAPVAASLLGVAVCVLGICRPRRHRRPADSGDPAAEALSKFEVKAAPPAERRASAEASRKRLRRPDPTAAWRDFVPTEQWQEVRGRACGRTLQATPPTSESQATERKRAPESIGIEPALRPFTP